MPRGLRICVCVYVRFHMGPYSICATFIRPLAFQHTTANVLSPHHNRTFYAHTLVRYRITMPDIFFSPDNNNFSHMHVRAARAHTHARTHSRHPNALAARACHNGDNSNQVHSRRLRPTHSTNTSIHQYMECARARARVRVERGTPWGPRHHRCGSDMRATVVSAHKHLHVSAVRARTRMYRIG